MTDSRPAQPNEQPDPAPEPLATTGLRWRDRLLRRRTWLARPVIALAGLVVGVALAAGAYAVVSDGHGGRDGREQERSADHGHGGSASGRAPATADRSQVGTAGEQTLSGAVSAVGGGTLTVSSGNGSLTFAVTSLTPVSGTVSTVTALKVGDRITIYATTPGSGGSAEVVRIVAG